MDREERGKEERKGEERGEKIISESKKTSKENESILCQNQIGS